ncbi:MAG: methyltransferase domain-containing protein [Clostridiales bacterium]|nr:methyltransferase domain-containing protein [Clostridiales bacterium]
MVKVGTGWERNRRTHFDDIVTNYDRIRPEYPQELFEDITSYSNFKENVNALEIGAGTGKATIPFLNRSYRITAVELGNNMANYLSKKFEKYENFNVIITSFEDVELKNNSFDLIYAGSAFHWVNADIGRPKAYELLKENGTIALFRYNAMTPHGDVIFDEIQAFYEKYYYSYYTTSSRPIIKTKADFMKPSEIYNSYRFEDLKNYGYKDIEMKFYDGSKTFSANEYIDWLDTMSDHRSLPKSNKTALYDGIRKTILNHGDSYKLDYLFQLYMGRK